MEIRNQSINDIRLGRELLSSWIIGLWSTVLSFCVEADKQYSCYVPGDI